MATRADVRRIALALPDTGEGAEGSGFHVLVKGKEKGFAWVWKERVEPKQPRVPNPAVLAVRVASLDDKEALIAAAPDKFFTEPHYNGFPAVLVRLAKVRVPELRGLLTEAHRCLAQPRARTKPARPKAQKSSSG